MAAPSNPQFTPSNSNSQFKLPGAQPTSPPVLGSSGYIGPRYTPTPVTPLTPGQQKNVAISNTLAQEKSYYSPPPDGGWTSRGLHDIDSKITTLNGLLDKVGPNSPRYPQLLGAKARQVAGAEKLMDKPMNVAKGSSTVNTRPASVVDPTGKSTGQGDLMRTHPEGFAPGDTTNKSSSTYGYYNPYRQEQENSAKRLASDQFASRKDTLNAGDNASYYANLNKK